MSEAPPSPALPIRIRGDSIFIPMRAEGTYGSDGAPKTLNLVVRGPQGDLILHFKLDPRLFPWIELNKMVNVNLAVIQIQLEGDAKLIGGDNPTIIRPN